MTDNTTVTLTKGSISVDILITRQVEHVMDKQLTQLAVPKQSPPLTYNIDLQRLKELITISGVLQEEISSSSTSKKNNLRTLIQTSGDITITWGAATNVQTYTGTIMKLIVREVKDRLGVGFLSGVASSTSTGALVDTDAKFDTGVQSVRPSTSSMVVNNTDGTTANVTAIVSDTELTLDADIFTVGDSYTIGLGLRTYEVTVSFALGTHRG